MDRYPTINWNTQVCCGRGGDGRDDQSYAVKLSQQLVAVGKWDGRGTLIVHEPQNTLRRVQQTHRGGRIGSVDIYVGIYSLVEGEEYEIKSSSQFIEHEVTFLDTTYSDHNI